MVETAIRAMFYYSHRLLMQNVQMDSITANRVWVSPPLNLHSSNDKVHISRSPPPPKMLVQKAKATTGMTLQEPLLAVMNLDIIDEASLLDRGSVVLVIC